MKRAGSSTARRVARAVLSQNEQLIVSGLPVQADDIVLGATSNATTVDYVIARGGSGQLSLYTLDANGAIKNGAAGIGSGSQTISGDLVVSGGDIDLGSSGAAGTVDIFPSTASKGKLTFSATDNTGNTTTTITNAAQAGAVTYTIPDYGASAKFRLDEGFTVASANGAVAAKSGVVYVTKAGVCAMTIADPTATTDDGKTLCIVSTTANAHTLDNSAGSGFNAGGAGSDVGTFGGAIGDNIVITAYQGKWHVVSKVNVTLA